MFYKLQEYLLNKNVSPEEKQRTLKILNWIIIPVFILGILFYFALFAGLISL